MTAVQRVFDVLSGGNADDVPREAVGIVAAVVGGVLTRIVLKFLWTRLSGRPVPNNPADRGVSWREALLWGMVSGAVAGLTRVGARRASGFVVT